MKKSSELYQKVAHEILESLIKYKCNNYADMSMIFYSLLKPFCVLSDGKYLYKGQFYKTIDDLPSEGKEIYEYCLSLIENKIVEHYFEN